MSSKADTLTVNILDKDYQVACPAEERPALKEAAHYLDQQMRSIRDTGKVVGGERIAVMAALNISYELLQANAQGDAQLGAAAEDMEQLNRKLDEALHDLRQLQI